LNIEKFDFKRNKDIFQYVSPDCKKDDETIYVTGSAGSYHVLLICNLFLSCNNPLFIFVRDSKCAEILAYECTSFLGEESIALFPSKEAIPYNMKSPFGPTFETRIRALSQLMNGEKKIFIAPSVTLIQKIIPQKQLFDKIIRLHVGDEISIEKLSEWLYENGFHRETMVQDIGEFSIRGGIVDVYSFSTLNPIRIEFWGDCIESIREFDVFKQKSLKQKKTVDIFPMKEYIFSNLQIEQALEKINTFCKDQNDFFDKAEKLTHKWKSQGDHDGIEWFFHWFDCSYETILDYLPPDCCIFWNDDYTIQHRLEESIYKYENHLKRVPETFLPFVTKVESLLVPVNVVCDDLSTYKRIFINTGSFYQKESAVKLPLLEQTSFNNNIKLLISDLISKERSGYSVIILCDNLGHAERLQELIENECPSTLIKLGFIEKGFIDTNNKIAIYSESQIFNYQKRLIKSKRAKYGLPIKSYDSLVPGDFVVHLDHGIAEFSGIEPIRTTGIHQDCMVLKYQNNATVYIPVHDFHKVQKYIGKDSVQPTLSQLGTSRWEKQKERTRKSLQEMAESLVELYAKRKYMKGIQFCRDSVWQKEFEDSFIFELTPDQQSAINDVKKDMESERPMDRLVCGDVGFGKTEIALRAAFKAVNNNFQVALLAPTTILAAQHFATFSDRMANFPIKVAAMSRFQKPKEQKKNIEELCGGKIDIVVGTHRILSQDVEFKNLGLLIIDEEQHFGVRHKEKLKEYRYKIDVLSLTATPIPRTMHMSLIGIRDISIINTPPRNRLPIETHVSEYHDEILKSAIENELDRGGQVYVVNNRIKNLSHIQDTIELSVPRARLAIAHGQMVERELELIMKEFVAGRYDVLLSTAIIESGLDIPNVNTIIVTRAEILGLSQLYQLRGRVGRSSEQAFAYFLTNSFEQLKPVSLKRLRALEQYTDLGSGFQIAMRDLEIRGAGSILGTYQHGFIAAVGFELYSQLLKEEIDRILGNEPKQDKKEIKIDIPIDAYIPSNYISDSSTRILIYQECSSCNTIDEITDLRNSIVDRFGPIPKPVKALLLIMEIKLLGQELNISHLDLNEKENIFSFSFYGNDSEVKGYIEKTLSLSKQQFEIVYGKPIQLKTAFQSIALFQKVYQIKEIFSGLIT
jgi:transcription-repair coupling factor (superfamily II helicase)